MAKKQATQEQQAGKPTYEQLVKIIGDMDRRLQDKSKMEQINEITARLNFLFKVIENSDQFPAEYVNKVSEDIMTILPAGEDANPENAENSQSNEQ